MRVLMVAPRYVQRTGDFYQFPLGLGYVTSALKAAGHTVHVLNTNHSDVSPDQQVEEAVQRFDPDMCATGGLSPFLPQIQKIFSTARRVKPSIINIAGGGVASSEPDLVPVVMDADVGVIGEGEETIIELADAYLRGHDISKVDGIVFRNARGGAVRTPARESNRSLGDLAWPDYEAFGFGQVIESQRPMDNYFFHTHDRPRAIDMICSRSCPYRCTFCFHPTGKVYRDRPLDDFFAELDSLVKAYGINSVAIIDELFSLKKRRLLEFCERIAPYKLHWVVQLHVAVADDNILDAMKASGCTYISYGVESMSPEVLLSMKKMTKRDRIHSVLHSTSERGIGIQGNLIFGDTAETIATSNDSMGWWAANRPLMINVTKLQVYPGSPDYLAAVEDGLVTDRERFVETQDINLNISKINDPDMNELDKKLGIFQHALLRLAPVVEFSRQPQDDDQRGESWRVVWGLPALRAAQHLQPRPGHDHELPLRDSNDLPRLPDAVGHREPRGPEVPRAPGEAAPRSRGVCAGDGDEGDRTPVEGLHHVPSDSDPRALVRAGAPGESPAIHRSRGELLQAMDHAALAVRQNPFEPELHLFYADLLVEERAVAAARLFYARRCSLTRLTKSRPPRWRASTAPSSPTPTARPSSCRIPTNPRRRAAGKMSSSRWPSSASRGSKTSTTPRLRCSSSTDAASVSNPSRHLKANLAALAAADKQPAVDVESSSGRVRVEPGVGADLDIRIATAKGDWVRVQPPHAPRAEADRLVADLPAEPAGSTVFVIGAGSGHILAALEARYPTIHAVVVEPDPALARALLTRRDWSAWITSGRLHLLVGPRYVGSAGAWALYDSDDQPSVITNPVLAMEWPAEVKAASEIVRQITFGAQANRHARRQNAGTYLLNTFAAIALARSQRRRGGAHECGERHSRDRGGRRAVTRGQHRDRAGGVRRQDRHLRRYRAAAVAETTRDPDIRGRS
jgi:radical SAM superfamily enzyme YgiQ (UPF0313 family)